MARADGIEPPTSLVITQGALPLSIRTHGLPPEWKLAQAPPHARAGLARRDADGHGLAVALADDLERDFMTQQVNGEAQELALVAHAKGYCVCAGICGARLACGVDGLGDCYARVQVLTHDDVVSRGSLSGLTVNVD